MVQKNKKVLIIKVGYSETLDPKISNVTSYGDVLRTTVVLNLYKNDHVTWLVDENAYPILRDNPFVDRILIYNLTSVLQLHSEHFDTVINLEKVPGLCALAGQINACRRYGFRFDVKTGEAEAYDGTHRALSVCNNENEKKNHNKYWQEHLFEMVGSEWKGEEYVFGYKPDQEEIYDIGFNYMVGNKWPSKAWPMEHWQQLESLLKNEYTVSWQQGLNNMDEYFEWINSCRLIVTNDSFGLHLAIALKKKIVALYGPTNPKETYLYGRGISLISEGHFCPYLPCYVPKCKFQKFCLGEIKPEFVYKELKKLFKQEPSKS
ncbi:MAG: glycosyltransferase family 9 protein [Deltaproteobacteria bacterium]|nr:MAG: glycosyltransferase family 9 protein [Deltaproteobacteria bacterium]